MSSLETTDPSVVKACCATAYGHDLAGYLLGDSFHPGGPDLTRRLAEAMDLWPGERVLDVAAGVGTTALLLAQEYQVDVRGVDLGDAQVARARERVAAAHYGGQVRFEVGDAEQLPLDDASVDGVVCECALCTFPDKATAAAEMARVLRPGGTVGITDVWLDPDRLDPELRGLAARVACIADARPIEEVCALLEATGLVIGTVERHDAALLEIIDRVDARLRVARMLAPEAVDGVDIARAIDLATEAAATVRRGDAGYVLLTATKR